MAQIARRSKVAGTTRPRGYAEEGITADGFPTVLKMLTIRGSFIRTPPGAGRRAEFWSPQKCDAARLVDLLHHPQMAESEFFGTHSRIAQSLR